MELTVLGHTVRHPIEHVEVFPAGDEQAQSRAVAFSLHTYSDPLSSIEADTESLHAMLALLRAYSPERLKYSEMDIILEPVLAWLEMKASMPLR